MDSDGQKTGTATSARSIIRRFAHLLSAQGVEGVGSALFFLYLAWVDKTLYGEVMLAMAAGVVVMKVVQFGLYYPLVSELGGAPFQQCPQIMNRVNLVKLALLIPTMGFVIGMALYKGFSFRLAWGFFFVSLGFSLEAIAETFFAELRVRGRQHQEARIKIIASSAGYGFGFVTVFFGVNPMITALFILVSGVIRIGFCLFIYLRDYPDNWRVIPGSGAVWSMFTAGIVFALIEIFGIIYNKANVFFLESAVGVDGVAIYSATFNIVDSISILASEQLLGWVIFPLLASLWWKNREKIGPIVRRTAQWLFVLAFMVMFFLYVWSDQIIGLIYPAGFKDAAWMQKYLVLTILFSFESNLFCYLMMVAGAAKVLLLFVILSTAVNLLLNVALVYPYGLLGSCLVIVLTKLFMTVLTLGYCQIRLRFFRARDLLFPVGLTGSSLGLFFLLEPHMLYQRAVLITYMYFFLLLWRPGMKLMGRLPGRRSIEEEQ